jgi:quercetin dioxygenase-like cupin family protein
MADLTHTTFSTTPTLRPTRRTHGRTLDAHVLQPGERLPAARMDSARSQSIGVLEGVVYVVLEEDEVVLTPGESIRIPAGEPRRAWNAGDATARVLVSDVAVLAAAA